ncbi:hypothetical protein HW423_05450 [Aerococcaceae bacterium INB8]|uniref:Family 2 glycosyl transferase n=1 Tax=Ruoffia halotolerans TaxID=2748684 RepID=A0A839A4R8_9LACT|nr:hypothetical protein [Ruoffia halotolerans]MBA5729226.1 hypothetical protein [Ruoffia halotolerans]
MKRYYLIIIFIAIFASLPFIIWQTQSPKDLSVAVIDKTVPTDNYREHKGVHWVLNHLKISNLDGDEFDNAGDYYGIVPTYSEETEEVIYEERVLPTDYSEYDAIYLADTYGVYEEKSNGKIYGGITQAEWEAIYSRLNQPEPSLLIAEFNSFASPTDEVVREAITNHLGITWSGWLGRYFTELNPNLNQEFPQRVSEMYGDEWNYSGPGIILVNDFTQETVVLEKEKHITEEGIRVLFNKLGEEIFNLTESSEYDFWFDIITPHSNTEVLATYDWSLTEEGKNKLNHYDIPLEPVAVTRNIQGSHQNIYFAGDYSDKPDLPSYYQVSGMAKINQWVADIRDESFYWSTFAPMLTTLFEQFESDLSVSTDIQAQTVSDNVENEEKYSFRVTDTQFEVLKEGKWEPLTIKGVNMGMGKPGYYPGEAAITQAEYARWFEMIGEMNANTIRVYTIHPPGFYRALKEYNESHEEPIYIFHGVWMNEEMSLASENVFESDNLNDFQEEIRKIVDLTHGNRIISEKPGHASGIYDADISDYVIGWIIGTEWNPHVVVGTNKDNKGIGDYHGKYFETQGASPFEYFLAEQMELMTAYELENYGEHRPMSFTNWVTTDLLDHPTESAEDEDLVSVNPNVIYTLNEAQETGQFASYHVYPYYPDFLNYTSEYNEYIDFRGEKNNYAAYLNELHEAHRIPVLIAEFGIPASRGRTHENPFGRHQGGMSEEEQGIIVSEMYEEIIHEGMLGGLVFTWQDEWFKRTWNTMDYDNPDRRPFWSNAQTNEQQFGILSFDKHKIRINGDITDWESQQSALIQASKESDPIQAVYVDHDERYLYLRIDYDNQVDGYPVLTFDTVPNQGNRHINSLDGYELSEAAEFVLSLQPGDSRILVDTYYDFFTIQYGLILEMLDAEIENPEKNSGNFVPIQFALNKQYYVVEESEWLPFVAYETGKLKEGNGDPEAENYDSLADYYVNDDEGLIEMRLPWMLLSSRDPSQKEFQGNLIEEGLDASVTTNGITIGALFVNHDNEVIYQSSSQKYSWENWDLPQSQERLKQSYNIIQKTFGNY